MGYQNHTLADLKLLMAEKWEQTPFWVDEEARLAINESCRIWNMLTGMWKRRVVFTLDTNQVWVPLPSTLVYSVRVEWKSYPLGQSSLASLNNGRPFWQGENTGMATPGSGIPSRPTLWAPAGLAMIAIWPADSAGCNSLVVDGVRHTPILRVDSDYLDMGDQELNTLLGMALHVAAFKVGGSIHKGTFPYYQAFIQAAADQNSRLKSSSFFRKVMGLDLTRSEIPMRGPRVTMPAASGAA